MSSITTLFHSVAARPWQRRKKLHQWLHLQIVRGSPRVCVFAQYSLEHNRATWQQDIGVQFLASVNVVFHDVLKRNVMEIAGPFASETWLEQHFFAAEAFGANSGDVSVWELVGLLLVNCAVDLCSVL